MRLDGVEKFIVGQGGVAQAQFVKGRALLAQHVAHAEAGPLEELAQQQPRRRGFQVLNDVRLDPGVADQAQRVARRAAGRVVVDDDVHVRPLSGRARAG